MMNRLAKFGLLAGACMASYIGFNSMAQDNNQNSFSIKNIHTKPADKTPLKLFAWGAGLQGQLGVGTEPVAICSPTEISLETVDKLVYIAASNDLSAAINEKGNIYSWGKTKGMMTQGDRGMTANLLAPTLVPFPELQKEKFIQVACGRTHIAAVTEDGKVYTWGNYEDGKLGLTLKKQDPNDMRDYHPTNYSDKAMFGKVKGVLETKKIIQVACGFHHTLFLSAEGDLYACGSGKEGAIGLGNWANKELPEQIPKISNVKKVCCGSEFSMALTADGKIFSWGRNNYGQLGITGQQSSKENTPHELILPKGIIVADISCGEEHAALLTKEGEVYTWGFGHDGQLGHSNKTHLTTPTKITGLDFKGIKVVCGGGHTGIITQEHDFYLFGRGRDGQLGRGDKVESIAVSRYFPTKVEYFTNGKMKVLDVALGANHTLALVN